MLLDPHTLARTSLGTLFGLPPMETKSAQPKAKNGPHPMRARKTTADRLREALFLLSGQCAKCLKHEESAWSSITFSGTRHEVTLAFEGAEDVANGEEFMELLPEHEFTIPGQLVADASIREVDHRFGLHERLEVTAVLLLLEES